ncbi:hypothetical protein [Virgibacillus salexigens]|uniref:hypothetical protein n=1 Tax=Virgibacillus massiliensis TaxID=1462526 RepID=UPI001372102E|nr:hypothetical protein [Virgibacillus massiliensis]MYL43987.1 hypothetical protein [Virgibacillus massiliensis]
MSNTYTIAFTEHVGNFDITVETNYNFNADNDENAIDIANHLQLISENYELYYDKTKDDIVMDITENGSFDKASITKYTFYDETKGEYKKMKFEDGTTFYPVMNEECFVELNKLQFLNTLKEYYKEYLKNKDRLSFGSLNYGVRRIN